jgi:hypothetical protein
VTFYADTESGIRLHDPTRSDLLDLIDGLNDTDNTFIVVHPPADDAEWFISVSKNIGTFGGYELDRHDPQTGERVITTAATPTTIADDVLAWTHQR